MAGWQVELRRDGFDPTAYELKDASYASRAPRGDVSIIIPAKGSDEWMDLVRRCLPGHPCRCPFALKVLDEVPGVAWAHISASRAVLLYHDGELLHYQHNGKLMKKFDEDLYPVPGEHRLRPLTPSTRIGERKPEKRPQNPQGPMPQRGDQRSLVAKLRAL